jgi:dTDP-4-dehydrorhamnose reductase
MRWLITGANGQLGTALTALLGRSAVPLSRAELDITSAEAVAAAVAEINPDVVVNAAGWTAVDDAETAEDEAYAANATAVAQLAAAAGPRLIHVSTDYVFDGAAERPYETDDLPAPRTAYGRTKLAGEQAALAAGATVVRTAWVYGGPGRNFVDTMLRLAEAGRTVDVVNDQVGSPTWVGDLAGALISLGARGGLFHFVNGGQASWFDLARATFELGGHDPGRVRPVPTSAMPRPAPRPARSVLSTASLTTAGLAAPRPWRAALADCIAARPALTVSPVTAADPSVAALVNALTADLASSGYTAEQTFGYPVDRLTSSGVHLVAASSGADVVGIGGIELQADGLAELKRFFVVPSWRGSIAAESILDALFAHARSNGVRAVRLETGDKQHAAMAFYRRNGFEEIPRFGPYVDSATSVCMQRPLTRPS